MIKVSEGLGMSKRGIIKYQGHSLFFFLTFYQVKVMSHFLAVIYISPDSTLKESCLG